MKKPVHMLVLIVVLGVGVAPLSARQRETRSMLEGTANKEVAHDATPHAPTPAEHYVLARLREGEVADLNEFAASEQDRILSGSFITDLLTTASERYRLPAHGVQILNARVQGDIDLENQEIPYDVKLLSCTFEDFVDATRAHFQKGLTIDGSHFNGSVDFSSVVFVYDLMASDTEFRNIKKDSDPNGTAGAFFSGISTGGYLYLVRARFEQRADFSSARIERGLVADNASFTAEADFGDVNVKGDGLFRNTTFEGRASFEDARFTDLYLSDATFSENELTILSGLKIDTAALEGVSAPGKIQTENMNFQSVSPAVWAKLKTTISKWHCDSEFYESLEALFRRRGFTEQADEIYVERRKQEREQMSLPGRIVDLGEWLFLGYGRDLGRLLYWSALLVVIGWVVFYSERGMQTKKPGDAELYKGKYSGFWYSVDLLVPVIHLDQADLWQPRDNRRIARFYARFHKIVGNLLVPIGLAALTGIIRK
jgi:hypothetical protein